MTTPSPRRAWALDGTVVDGSCCPRSLRRANPAWGGSSTTTDAVIKPTPSADVGTPVVLDGHNDISTTIVLEGIPVQPYHAIPTNPERHAATSMSVQEDRANGNLLAAHEEEQSSSTDKGENLPTRAPPPTRWNAGSRQRTRVTTYDVEHTVALDGQMWRSSQTHYVCDNTEGGIHVSPDGPRQLSFRRGTTWSSSTDNAAVVQDNCAPSVGPQHGKQNLRTVVQSQVNVIGAQHGKQNLRTVVQSQVNVIITIYDVVNDFSY
ncbi:hypothetical protein D9756_002851 [Leucocoprinus leucothites]|uniref:Uncharacterized protein n=1 Tax=Leucocoprinus leucothites TaxID=201217 RepID=A0A8H5GCI5_9AGAR|nr:hypothetical protein D9756_002851 [Leucoagaricus leucothites]